MDKKAAIRNITITTIMQIMIVFCAFLARQQLIRVLGVEANGIYALFISIFSFLSVVELGFAMVITYNLYKPIYNKEYETATALFYLSRKIFVIIGVFILVAGLILTPFVPMIAQGNTGEINIILGYLMFLIGSVIPFFVIYKLAFIDAHKDTHISSMLRSSAIIFQYIVQTIILILTGSFIYFVSTILITNIIYFVLMSLIFNRRYGHLLIEARPLNSEIKKDVLEKTKAQLFHKIGLLGTNTINNILISSIISVIVLGYFSNYILIITAISNIFSLMFNAIVPVIGHARQEMSGEQFEKLFRKIYTIGVVVGIVVFLGYLAVADDLIALLFGNELVLEQNVAIIIALNAFVQFLRRPALLFRDATGTFYHDRFKPIIEGVLGVSLSILFLNLWGVIGVALSALVADIVVNHIIEPYVVYKYQFQMKPKKYYFGNYAIIIIFILVGMGFQYIPWLNSGNNFMALVINGFTSVLVSIIVILIIYILNSTFRKTFNELIFFLVKMIKSKILRKTK